MAEALHPDEGIGQFFHVAATKLALFRQTSNREREIIHLTQLSKVKMEVKVEVKMDNTKTNIYIIMYARKTNLFTNYVMIKSNLGRNKLSLQTEQVQIHCQRSIDFYTESIAY